MHLNSFFLKCKYRKYMSQLCKMSYTYMKVQHQLGLLYFQVDEDLVCMDMISTFHYLVIIYQSFNVKVSWKIWKTNQFRTYFSSIILIQTFLKIYVKLIINSMKCSMISKCNLNRFLIYIYLILILKRNYFWH